MKICIEKAYCQEQPAAQKNTSSWEYGMFGDTSIQRNLQASEQEGTQREKADGYRHKGETVKQAWKFTCVVIRTCTYTVSKQRRIHEQAHRCPTKRTCRYSLVQAYKHTDIHTQPHASYGMFKHPTTQMSKRMGKQVQVLTDSRPLRRTSAATST